MLLLLETSSGYGLFRAADKLESLSASEVIEYFQTEKPEDEKLKMIKYMPFKNSQQAVKEAVELSNSKMGKSLKKFLKSEIVKQNLTEKLAVADKMLGNDITTSLKIPVLSSNATNEIFRLVREQVHDLLQGVGDQNLQKMQLSLAHSLTRFKLKFSTDKIDIMITQAIGLLTDLDKELNNIAMRLKEWYGYHFPEMAGIISDNFLYAQLVKKIKMRTEDLPDMSEVVDADIEEAIRRAATMTTGMDLADEDVTSILLLAEDVISLSEYRRVLTEYLKHRMEALAPNLTYMVGELVGAKLVAAAGNLSSLSKMPGSTIQLLGAEKALFRALKNKTQTPKYGIIFNAALVSGATTKARGKVARTLAAKLALCSRVDTKEKQVTVGKPFKAILERRVRELADAEKTPMSSASRMPSAKYVPKRQERPQEIESPPESSKRIKKEY